MIEYLANNQELILGAVTTLGLLTLYVLNLYRQVIAILSDAPEIAENHRPKHLRRVKRKVEQIADMSKDPILRFLIKRIAAKAEKRIGK